MSLLDEFDYFVAKPRGWLKSFDVEKLCPAPLTR
jgi:hypothetical protein